MPWATSARNRGKFSSCRCYGQTEAVDSDTGAAKVFGEKAGYWDKYNEITDKYDEDMMDRLNTGLDNLLIFVSAPSKLQYIMLSAHQPSAQAGLFSAVNSAFLVVTLGALSPDPMAETNYLLRLLVLRVDNSTLTTEDLNPSFPPTPGLVRQNCFFFASLFSSLLAAAGAVLAKQWLANYERTGQTGPLEEQALRRTEKFLGSEKWGLRYVVEALPTLILISLGLFFVAIGDYVWTINREVAILIIVFSTVGSFLYFLMLLSAAVFSQCPFRTAPSELLVGFYQLALRPLVLLGRNILIAVVGVVVAAPLMGVVGAVPLFRDPEHQINQALSRFITWMDKLVTPTRRLWSPNSLVVSRRLNAELLHAESARLMLDVSPHEDVIVSVARNVLALREFSSLQRLARSTAVVSLAHHLNMQIFDLQKAHSIASEERAIITARALVHVLHTDPIRYGKEVLACLLGFPISDAAGICDGFATELQVLWMCIIRVCAQVSTLKAVRDDASTTWDLVFQELPFNRLTKQGFERPDRLDVSTLETYLHQLILSDIFLLPKQSLANVKTENVEIEDFIWSVRSILARGSISSSASLVSLVARALSIALDHILESEDSNRPPLPNWQSRLKMAWSIRAG